MMVPFWHVNHAIGLDFTPQSNRARSFFVLYTFIMGKMADAFQSSTNEVMDYYIGGINTIWKFLGWNTMLALM